MVWEQTIWATGTWGRTGTHYHCASIAVDEEHVTVYGCHVNSIYFEQFSLKGTPKVRFSSTRWLYDTIDEPSDFSDK